MVDKSVVERKVKKEMHKKCGVLVLTGFWIANSQLGTIPYMTWAKMLKYAVISVNDWKNIRNAKKMNKKKWFVRAFQIH